MTLECLGTLYASLRGVDAEIFVVDNGSQDGSAAAIRDAFPAVNVIANVENRGFAAANNQAIRVSRGEYVLLLNSDAFPKSDAVQRLVAYLDANPGVAVVGPRVLNRDESLQKSCYPFPGPWRAVCDYLLLTAAFPNSRLFGDYRAWAHDDERVVDFVIGACMLVRRCALDQVGLLDEDFFFYGEEADWCRRFHSAKWKVCFTPSAEIYHLNGASGATQPDRVLNEFRRAQERFMRKHHGMAALILFRIVVVLGSVLRIAAFGVIALVAPGKRSARLALVRKWCRILLWTLGRRGPGLTGAPKKGVSRHHSVVAEAGSELAARTGAESAG
jgi:GT2 family glycosyltransferase